MTFSFYEGHLNLGLQTALSSDVSLIDHQPSFPFYLQLYPEFLARTPPRWLCFWSLKHTVIQLPCFNFSILLQRITLSERSSYEIIPVVYMTVKKKLKLQCLWKSYRYQLLFNEDFVIFRGRRRDAGLGHWLIRDLVISKQVSNQILVLTGR